MRFVCFFLFVAVVVGFDFDFDATSVTPTPISEHAAVPDTLTDASIVVVELVLNTTTVAPKNETTTATVTTTTATVTTTTTTPTTKKDEEEQVGSEEGSTLTSTFGTQNIPKVEVIVTRSIYRLMDEAFRQHLTSFEGRIAHLLNEKEKMKEVIDRFNPTFDDNFFEKAFDESNGIIEEKAW